MPECDRSSRLIVFAGLPGAGKSTLADALGRELGIPVVSVDPIEAGLHRAGLRPDQPLGLAAYLVAANLADQILGLGQAVIIDAVNGAAEARSGWRALGERHGTPVRYVEVVCGDAAVHRRRLEERSPRFEGVAEPGGDEVEARRAELADWADPRLVVDSRDPLLENLARTQAWVASPTAGPPLPPPNR